MGLRTADPETLPHAVAGPFALFDGSRFVFNQSSWQAVTALRMLWRYGSAPLRFQGLPKAMFRRFLRIYDLQVKKAWPWTHNIPPAQVWWNDEILSLKEQ